MSAKPHIIYNKYSHLHGATTTSIHANNQTKHTINQCTITDTTPSNPNSQYESNPIIQSLPSYPDHINTPRTRYPFHTINTNSINPIQSIQIQSLPSIHSNIVQWPITQINELQSYTLIPYTHVQLSLSI